MGTVNLVRIRLRYTDVDSFVEKFAPNVTRGGLFLASRNIQPVDAVIDFEIQLVNGAVALAGQGKVTWVKEFNPADPNRPYGMGVQFIAVSADSRAVLARILRSKGAGQPPPRGLTGMHATLGSGPLGPNGKPAPVVVDTTVDLAGEFGIDEGALRQVLDRRRMMADRIDDDLSDLLRREPPEPVSLAQALADLPRLLDPQNSRRRSSAGFRVVDPTEAAVQVTAPAAATAEPSPAETTVVTEADDDDEAEPRTAMEPAAPLDTEAAGAIPAAIVDEPSSRSRSGRSSRRRRP